MSRTAPRAAAITAAAALFVLAGCGQTSTPDAHPAAAASTTIRPAVAPTPTGSVPVSQTCAELRDALTQLGPVIQGASTDPAGSAAAIDDNAPRIAAIARHAQPDLAVPISKLNLDLDMFAMSLLGRDSLGAISQALPAVTADVKAITSLCS